MFERSGEKVKGISKTIFYVNVAIAGIMMIVALYFCSIPVGLVIGIPILFASIIISILAWVSSVFLYAFGDLVDSNQRILEMLMKGSAKEKVTNDKEDVDNSNSNIENNSGKRIDNLNSEYTYTVLFDTDEKYDVQMDSDNCSWDDIENKCIREGKNNWIKSIIRKGDGKELRR